MDEHLRLTFLLGTVALCALVGIYYCAVRARTQARQRLDQGIRVALSRPVEDESAAVPTARSDG
jgi:hypothetical protein